jgi:hypothetical protein
MRLPACLSPLPADAQGCAREGDHRRGRARAVVARLEWLPRKALTRADGYDANGEATRPKIEADLNLGEKFDPVKEHARAVVETQQLHQV